MFDEFEKRDVVVIAVAQEDTDLESHGKFLKHFDPKPRFEIMADLNREQTGKYRRTTTYVVDRDGVVREIFPATIRTRPSWRAVLNRIDEIQEGS